MWDLNSLLSFLMREPQHIYDWAHEMSCSEDGSKSEVPVGPHLPRHFIIHHPINKWSVFESLVTRPGHLKRPPFVSDPVGREVVHADVDQNPDVSFKEFRDVKLITMIRVSGCVVS